MVRLVDDLLDISRITQGKIKLQVKRMNLKRAIEMALEGSREILDKAHHELTVSIPKGDICINGDLTRITQIIQNVLNNAGKYTLPGGKIWLTVKKKKGEAFINVRDTGVGIPPNMQSKIFDMFSQIENTSEQARSGLGIGLSVVKRLVEMHGGTIEAISEGEGKGSEFILRLPLADDGQQLADEVPVQETIKPPQSNSLIPESAPEPNPSKSKNILVVDDNADAAQMLEILLSMEGHKVQLAYDAETGLLMAGEFNPDVCLLDIGLPGMNGYEAARELRQFLPDALLISISGWGQEEDQRRSKEAGFDHHLVKPVEIEDITKLIEEE
jgi:two-component system CheB/CheR fusion protein